MWKKIKVAVGALGLLGLAGVAGAAFLYGNGGFVVIAPAGVSVKTTLDGKELGTVAPGAHQRFPIAQGGHTVTLTGSGGKSKSYREMVENGMFDKTLPVGATRNVVRPAMNGRELYQTLAELRPGLKVLFMSGYTENVIAHSGVLEQGTEFIQKPFSMQNLLQRVREALDANP